MHEYKELYIGGRWAEPATDRSIDVIQPHSEQLVGRTLEATAGDVDRAVGAARRASDTGEWPRTDPAERLSAVHRFAAAYRSRQDELPQLISTETGSPIWFSQVGRAPRRWRWMPCSPPRGGRHGRNAARVTSAARRTIRCDAARLFLPSGASQWCRRAIRVEPVRATSSASGRSGALGNSGILCCQ
ncbi:MAG: aldehyde dehydrogenase family protein [Haloechinothrix sp.]